MLKKIFGVVAALMLLITAPSARADSGAGGPSPTQVITEFDAALIDVMKNADALGYDGRLQKLDPVIRHVFDLPTMTRIVAGYTWSDWTDAQRATVTEAFTKFVISTYARRFDGYAGETFSIKGTQPQQSGIEVLTQLNRPTDTPVVLNYLLLQQAGAPWRIVDVFLTGSISELATRRSEFSAVIDEDGYQGLLDALKAKTNDNPEAQ